MNGAVMDREVAGRFVEDWRATWCKVDIDAVVSHFAEDAEMRSPLALKLTDWRCVSTLGCSRAPLKAYHLPSAGITVKVRSIDVSRVRGHQPAN